MPDETAGPNYLAINTVESTKVWIEEVMMHTDGEVTADAIQQCVNDLRERKIESVPYTRSPLAQWSVVACHNEPSKNWYAMRGNSIHASLVVDLRSANAQASIEDTLHHKCRAGPAGREITASTVKGFPHLLSVRDNKHPPTPYVKECLFLPPVTRQFIGAPESVLQQDHRQYPKRIIDMPVELDAYARRGGSPWKGSGGSVVYPDAYIDEVVEQRSRFSNAKLTELTATQYDDLRTKLPAECFEQHKKQKTK